VNAFYEPQRIMRQTLLGFEKNFTPTYRAY